MASSNGYSTSEIVSMQNDAIRRVNEMQRLARQHIAADPPILENSSPILSNAPPAFNPTSTVCTPQHNNSKLHSLLSPITDMFGSNNILSGFLDNFNIDTETILLIGLGIILLNESADIALILALAYIFL